MGREQIVLAHQAEHPLAGNPDVADRPEAEPRPCGSPRPPRAMPPGRLRSPPAAPGPRSRASVPDALPAAARRAGRRSWRRTRSGPCPRRRRPAAGRRPDPCRARWRHSSPRPPPPKGRRSPSWPPAVPPAWSTLRSASWRYPVPPAPDRPLRCLSEGVDPADRFLTPLLEPEDLYANWRDRSCTGSSRKSRRTTSRLRATVHRWPSPSGPAGKACPGENVDEPSSPAFTTGPSTATFFSKLSVMFRSSLDTSIKPILCPRKSGPTHISVLAPKRARKAEIAKQSQRRNKHLGDCIQRKNVKNERRDNLLIRFCLKKMADLVGQRRIVVGNDRYRKIIRGGSVRCTVFPFLQSRRTEGSPSKSAHINAWSTAS